jgi:hypothetical protein
MPQNSNRKGFAVGALFALVASIFTVAPAAVAADGDQLQFTPAKGTTYTSLVTEDFQMAVSFKPAYAASSYARLSYIVEKAAGSLDIQVTTSAQALTVGNLSATSTSNSVLASTGTKLTFSPVATTDSGLNGIVLQPSTGSGVANVTSESAKTVVKVTAFIDSSPTNGVLDADEWFVTKEVTFIPFSGLTAALTLTQPSEGDVWATASATVAGINLEQANGDFFFAFSSSAQTSTASKSGVISATAVLSASTAVAALGSNTSVSAQLRYVTDGAASDIYDGVAVTAASKLGATARTFQNATLSAVVGSNATNSLVVRPNSAFSVKLGVSTGSSSVSGLAVTWAVSSSAALSTTRTLGVAGTNYTVSAASFAATSTTGTDGFATLALATDGYAAGQTVVVTATVQGVTKTQTFTLTAPTYKVENEYDYYSTTPGTAVTVNLEVTDQWGVKSALTTQRIKVTKGGTGFAYATTVSYLTPAAGAAAFVFTPEAATKTGSATIDTVLQSYDAASNLWTDGVSGTQVTVNVTSVTDAFSVSPAASVSGSISYVVNNVISWSSAITATVKNKGSNVTVASPDLIFRETGETATTSGTISVRASDLGVVSIEVASRKAGTHTLTWTVGGASTTSLFVVDAAAADSGKTITYDLSALPSGQTSKITGTVVDAEGNAVYTSGSADVIVSWAGQGLPFGTGVSVDTDAKGQFSINVLVQATEVGSGTITATYRPAGDSTSTKNVAVAKTLTIGVAAAEVNAVIGTFQGRWAVRVENAKGSTVVIKVGGNWYKLTASSDNFLFSRKSKVGATPLVKVWVDGELQNEQTITVK